MSKTAQRKRTYYLHGAADYKIFAAPFIPFAWKSHPLNKRYMAGFNFEKRNDELSVNNSLLQKIRVAFWMRGA
jgi:hypothetical protein